MERHVVIQTKDGPTVVLQEQEAPNWKKDLNLWLEREGYEGRVIEEE